MFHVYWMFTIVVIMLLYTMSFFTSLKVKCSDCQMASIPILDAPGLRGTCASGGSVCASNSGHGSNAISNVEAYQPEWARGDSEQMYHPEWDNTVLDSRVQMIVNASSYPSMMPPTPTITAPLLHAHKAGISSTMPKYSSRIIRKGGSDVLAAQIDAERGTQYADRGLWTQQNWWNIDSQNAALEIAHEILNDVPGQGELENSNFWRVDFQRNEDVSAAYV